MRRVREWIPKWARRRAKVACVRRMDGLMDWWIDGLLERKTHREFTSCLEEIRVAPVSVKICWMAAKSDISGLLDGWVDGLILLRQKHYGGQVLEGWNGGRNTSPLIPLPRAERVPRRTTPESPGG